MAGSASPRNPKSGRFHCLRQYRRKADIARRPMPSDPIVEALRRRSFKWAFGLLDQRPSGYSERSARDNHQVSERRRAAGPCLMQTDWIEIATPHVATKLALKRDGAGPGILFLHGWAHSSLAWQDVVPHFIQSNTCLTVDLPGFGDSPRLDEKHISIDRYADIVWKLLQDLSRQRALQFVVADSLSGLLVLDCLSRFESLPVERFLLSGVPLDGLPKLFRDVQAHAFTGLGLRLLRALPFEIANSLTVRSNHLTVHQRGRFERVITTMIRRSDPTTAGRLLIETGIGERAHGVATGRHGGAHRARVGSVTMPSFSMPERRMRSMVSTTKPYCSAWSARR